MDGLLNVFLAAIAAGVFIYLALFLLPFLRTLMAHWSVRSAMKNGLPESHYRCFHNFQIRTAIGRAAIDHLVVSPYGVFVVDSMALSGRITGTGKDLDWTRSRFRKREKFRSPLLKLSGEIKVLKPLLGLDESRFHPVAVFAGSEQFSHRMPEHVTRLDGLLLYLQSHDKSLLSFEEAERAALTIRKARVPQSRFRRLAQMCGLENSRKSTVSRQRTRRRQAGSAQVVLKTGAGVAVLALLFLLVIQSLQSAGKGSDALGQSQTAAGPFLAEAPPPVIELPLTGAVSAPAADEESRFPAPAYGSDDAQAAADGR
jgi:hypothetical protein